ncbi:MAG: DNA polymerase III subunit delta [Clostridia bacterium]|nr:DNA polymerase III subunit delta [Clostridia bacterium]
MAVSKKAESKQQMAELKKQLSENKLQNLYLFFGEETYLIDLNISRIAQLVPHMDFPDFNRISLNGSDCSLREIAESIEAFPMMTDRKLVIIKDSGAFRGKASAELREFYTEKINNLTDDTVVIFRESEVDKRSAVYKAAQKAGWTGEFSHLDDIDLITWVMREAKLLNRKITRENAALLISLTDRGLQTLKNELEKLAGYTEEEITAPSINKLTSRTLEAKVFDFCDCMMEKNSGKAIAVLEDLKTGKESPYGILYMLFSTFSKMLKAQILAERNEPYDGYAGELGVPRFSVKKYIDGAKKFSRQELCRILMLCVELDLSIKRGTISQWQAVEKLVLSGTERI